jgi:hypothetical protein
MEKQPFGLIIELKDDHLAARASGERTRNSVSTMTLQIFEAAVANQYSKVLVDVRGLKGRLSTLDSYLVVTEVFQKLRGRGLLRAAVLDSKDPGLRVRFIETVALNRGFNFRVFSSRKEALAWLAA